MLRQFQKISRLIERRFPERRLFLRSDTETRFVRLTPASQLLAWTGVSLFVGWSLFASAVLFMDSIGSGNIRDQARREQALYESRLNQLSLERDTRTTEALRAQERFNSALEKISELQVMLLESEDRRKEMEKGIDVIQATLRRTIKERDGARLTAEKLQAQIDAGDGVLAKAAIPDGDTESTVDFLADALDSVARQRDQQLEIAAKAEAYAEDLELERKLLLEKNDRIFSQLEDAVSLSLEPLDKMFESVGMSPENILNTVRQGYSGQGGPLTPLRLSTRGQEADADSLRANTILARLDKMNMYRIAAEKIPFALPVKNAYRRSSAFGPRGGRMHEGVDMAAPTGTPLYATADGLVTFAGRKNGYGLIVIIQHDFGFETRYAHQSKLRVKTGQRVSRGDRIGDMGSTGHSTGPHVHYEVRLNGTPVNPMKFIKAARNVF